MGSQHTGEDQLYERSEKRKTEEIQQYRYERMEEVDTKIPVAELEGRTTQRVSHVTGVLVQRNPSQVGEENLIYTEELAEYIAELRKAKRTLYTKI